MISHFYYYCNAENNNRHIWLQMCSCCTFSRQFKCLVITKFSVNVQSNSSMHHCECVVLCKDVRLQRGRFCTRSLASFIPGSSEDMNVLHPGVHSRPSGSLQFSGGGSKVTLLSSAFSSVHARCPKKVRQRDVMMDESGGWLVMRWMLAFLTKSCQRMFRILRRHHWSTASIHCISALLIAQHSDP